MFYLLRICPSTILKDAGSDSFGMTNTINAETILKCGSLEECALDKFICTVWQYKMSSFPVSDRTRGHIHPHIRFCAMASILYDIGALFQCWSRPGSPANSHAPPTNRLLPLDQHNAPPESVSTPSIVEHAPTDDPYICACSTWQKQYRVLTLLMGL